MRIITQTDMIDRFGEHELILRTNRESADGIDDAVLQRAIDDAEAEAGAYLQAARLQLAAPPPVLVIKVCDIARYYLYDDGVSQIVEDRYKQAVAWLRDVVRNPQMLDPEAVSPDAKASTCAVIPNQPESWGRM